MRNTLKFLTISVSLLSLSACMPDEESYNRDAERENSEAQVAHYAQSFQKYANDSLNAVIDSDLWETQTLPEGVLTLDTVALGSLNMGGAEAFLESAYCVIAGEDYHVTWFEGEDTDGRLFLKGLGADRAGRTASHIRPLIARNSFGIARGGDFEMADGSVKTLEGVCAGTLSIPEGTSVAVVPIPQPTVTTAAQNKYIMRTLGCTAGEEGARLQRIMASFMPSGMIMIGGASYPDEASVQGNNGLAWEVVSNTCTSPSMAVNLATRNITTDAINAAAIGGGGGGGEEDPEFNRPGRCGPGGRSEGGSCTIRDIVVDDLTDVPCTQVSDETEQEESQDDESYDTCNVTTDITIDPIDPTVYRGSGMAEEILTAMCGGDPAGSMGITIGSGRGFGGIHGGLSGRSGTYSFSSWSGDVAVKKTTTFYEMVEDLGTGEIRRENERTLIQFEGLHLQCDRNETISVACGAMYSPGGSQVEDSGPVYTRPRQILGWKDVERLIPSDPNDPSWSGGAMSCVWVDSREVGDCAGEIQERRFVATSPTNGGWSGWETVAAYDNCPIPPSEGGGGDSEPGESEPMGEGPDSDGIGCFLPGTPIVMVDGSLRAIEDLRSGDMTAFGRVLKTFARPDNEMIHTTRSGAFSRNGGLFEYDGIEATGQHAFFDGDQWIEMGDSEKVEKIHKPDIQMVYNLLMEDHLVPVMGLSGEIHYFADDLNNIHSVSERAMIRHSFTQMKVA